MEFLNISGINSPWVRVRNTDGTWHYRNEKTGEESTAPPQGWIGSNDPWSKLQNADGSWTWHNADDGKQQNTAPVGWVDSANSPWIRVQNFGTFKPNQNKARALLIQPEEDSSEMAADPASSAAWHYENTDTAELSQLPPPGWVGTNWPWIRAQAPDGRWTFLNMDRGTRHVERPSEWWIEPNARGWWLEPHEGGWWCGYKNCETVRQKNYLAALELRLRFVHQDLMNRTDRLSAYSRLLLWV
eukprot:SAG31_NODE_6940_length_1843_cov_1.086583_1_plen_243_part_00